MQTGYNTKFCDSNLAKCQFESLCSEQINYSKFFSNILFLTHKPWWSFEKSCLCETKVPKKFNDLLDLSKRWKARFARFFFGFQTKIRRHNLSVDLSFHVFFYQIFQKMGLCRSRFYEDHESYQSSFFLVSLIIWKDKI